MEEAESQLTTEKPVASIRKDKFKEWLKKPENLIILLVIILAFGVRLYYFSLTANQPIWWDEGEYLSAAKGYAGLVDYKLISLRLPGLPIFLSIFFMLNINEAVIKFLTMFLPSILLIILTYLLVKEMYNNKKIAIVATVIISFLWESLFYSNRFQTENLALLFEVLALIVLFRSYIKRQDTWFIKPKYSLLWIILLAFITIAFRAGNIIFLPGLFVFIMLLNKSRIFTKKGLIISAVLVILIVLAISIIGISKTGLMAYYHPELSFAWNSLTVFHGFYQSVVPNIPSLLFYGFLIGILIFAFDLFTGFSKLKSFNKDEGSIEFKSDIFNALLILSVLASFIFLIRPPAYEFRWFFPFLPAFLVFTAKGVVLGAEFIGGLFKNKKIATIIIIIVVILGAYTQWARADPIIKVKINSYLEVKEAGLWIKANSVSSDTIISASVPQLTYYSERKVNDFYINGSVVNSSVFNEKYYSIKPKYVFIYAYEASTPKWVFDWPASHNDTLIPVKVYYLDPQQTQVLGVIYQTNFR